MEEFPPVMLCSKNIATEYATAPSNGAKIACSPPSEGDHSNIILRVLRSNHKEQGKFKDNVIKKKKILLVKMKNNFCLIIVNKNNSDN